MTAAVAAVGWTASLLVPVDSASAAPVPAFDISADFSEPSLTGLRGTGPAEGTIWSWFKFSVNWGVPDGSTAGSTFGLVLPDTLQAQSNSIDLENPSGDLVAKCVVTTESGADPAWVECALTDFVTSNPKDIGGTLEFRVSGRDDLDPGNYDAVFTNGTSPLPSVPFEIVAQSPYSDGFHKWGYVIQTGDGYALRWVVIVPKDTASNSYVIDTLPSSDFTYIEGTGQLNSTGAMNQSGSEPAWGRSTSFEPSSVVDLDQGQELRFDLTGTTAGEYRRIQFNTTIPADLYDVRYFDEFYNSATLYWSDDSVRQSRPNVRGTNSYLAEGTGSGRNEPRVSVGDYVWFDEDRDGVQDEGEQGIEGVTLTLTGPDGAAVTDVNDVLVEPVKTGSQGEYLFEDLPVLPAGQSYTVTIDRDASASALDGLEPTVAEAGDDRSVDSSTWTADSIALDEGGLRDLTLDFGFVKSEEVVEPGRVSVGDYVWFDEDRDGVQGEGEQGIEGVTLTLTGPDGAAVTDVNDVLVEPVKTGSQGEYLFEDLPVLPAGQSYTVTIDRDASASALDGLEPTVAEAGDDRSVDSSTWTADSIALDEDGASDLTLDFGFVKPVVVVEEPGRVSVGDYVWFDEDRDGVQDEGEQGIPGVTLTLTGPDGAAVTDVNGNPVESTVTDGDGWYLFEDLPVLPAGRHYTVTIDQQASGVALEGFEPTVAEAGDDRSVDSSTWTADSIALDEDGASDLTLDFGFVKPVVVVEEPGRVSVGDYVWFDEDRDGVQDEGEQGIPGVTLTLTGPDGQQVVDVNGNPVEPTVTDGDGWYLFKDLPVLPAGQHYTVTVTTPAGFVPTVASAGDDREKDSSTGSAFSGDLTKDGDVDRSLDFGFVKPEPLSVPPVPGVDIEKVDVDGNDADTKAETVRTTASEMGLVFTVKNTGEEALTGVNVSDAILDGGAKVQNLLCTFPDDSTGVSWSGALEVGASFPCSATVIGLAVDDLHIDVAKVTATGIESGKQVSDEDAYHVVRIASLAVTGGEANVVAAVVGGLLTLVGAMLLWLRRRRMATIE